MLGKIRNKLDNYLISIVIPLKNWGVTPNQITIISLPLSLIASIFYFLQMPVLAGVFILLLGFMDILDGSLARISKKESIRGAVLDSTIDRFTEIIPMLFLGISNLSNWLIVTLAVFSSMLPSFVRAKIEKYSEKVPENIKYSIGERSERLIVLILFSFLYPVYTNSLNLALVIIIILSLYSTFVRLYSFLK